MPGFSGTLTRMIGPQQESSSLHRRAFLAATATAVIAAGSASPADAAVQAVPEHAGLLNARDHGAAGDGRTDDTQSLRDGIDRARRAGAAGLFLPAGTYLLSDALYLPSDFRLAGAGRDITVLKAVPETRFPMYKPDPRTVDIRQRRTMLTTESVGSVRERMVRNLSVERLTLDWSNCPTDGFGHSVCLLDSVDQGTLREVAVINAMPSDHPPTAAEVQAGGSNFRCECVMFSNARHGLMERCRLTDSGYRPLSVSYGSRDIVFRNGVIHAEKPVWRHCFSENHGDGIPRDERFVHAQLIFLNSTFILEGGTPGDGICSHTGTTHVENCDFYIIRPATSFWTVIRAFDGSRNCTYINNRFHCDIDHPAQFSIVSTTARTNPARGDDEAIVVERNIVDVSFGELESDRERALLQFQDGDRRLRITDNVLRVRWSGNGRREVIRLEGTRTFSVTGNLVEVAGEEANAQAATGVVLQGCRDGIVSGNVFSGRSVEPVRIDGEGEQVVVEQNL
jgi:hypothetical protein